MVVDYVAIEVYAGQDRVYVSARPTVIDSHVAYLEDQPDCPAFFDTVVLGSLFDILVVCPDSHTDVLVDSLEVVPVPHSTPLQ